MLPDSSLPPPAARGIKTAIENLAVPLFVFGIVFLLSAITLTFLLSPGRFPVKVGSSIVRLRDIAAEKQSLLFAQESLLKQRSLIDAQLATPVLSRVKLLRPQIKRVGSALQSIEAIRLSFTVHDWSLVTIAELSYADASEQITLLGSVADQSDRTATILASFVDSLRQSGQFRSVSEPEYQRVATKDGMNTTPFHLILHLKSGHS